MNTLLLGKNGQVGWELERALAPLGRVMSIGRETCSLEDADQLRALVKETTPDIIVNAAAYNAVDRAESETDKAARVNTVAPGILAEEAKAIGAFLVHYSSDFVFDGEKQSPYIETDAPNPLSAYGLSKLLGEQAVEAVGGGFLILRTSWVYSTRRPCFVTKVLAWARRFPQLKIVTDQTGSPTWARVLAAATSHMLALAGSKPEGWLADRSGLYHLGGTGVVNRNEWAKAILQYDPNKAEQVAAEILPAVSTDFPTPAIRPTFSALNCDKFADTFGFRLPPWEEALALALTP